MAGRDAAKSGLGVICLGYDGPPPTSGSYWSDGHFLFYDVEPLCHTEPGCPVDPETEVAWLLSMAEREDTDPGLASRLRRVARHIQSNSLG
jgi:hypothetical protein